MRYTQLLVARNIIGFLLFDLSRRSSDSPVIGFSFLFCIVVGIGIANFSPLVQRSTHTRAETVPEVVVVVIVIAVVYYEIRLTPRVYQLPIPTHPPPMPPTRAITSVYIYIRFPHSPNYKSVFFSHLKFTNHITYPHNHCSVQLIIMMYK